MEVNLPPPTPKEDLDKALEELTAHKQEWIDLAPTALTLTRQELDVFRVFIAARSRTLSSRRTTDRRNGA